MHLCPTRTLSVTESAHVFGSDHRELVDLRNLQLPLIAPDNIWWVSAQVIENLRMEVFETI